MLSVNVGLVIGIIVVVVLVLVILTVILWIISTRNKFIKMLEDIDNSLSRIDVYLTKRYDELTKLVDVVKGYSKHEINTLKEVVKLRNPGINSSIKEKMAFEKAIDDAFKTLNVVVESYPNLKADELFINLQKEIASVEENLQAARSNYNQNVSRYNKAILVFPNSLIASNRYSKKEYYEAPTSKQEDVKIEF